MYFSQSAFEYDGIAMRFSSLLYLTCHFLVPHVLVKDTLAAIVEEPTAGAKKNNFKTCRKSDVRNEDPADMVPGKPNGNTRRSLRAF